ncbi:MAG: sugar phosphate isomerase/epimerase [Lentisphaerae bacterium]|nr:sugar phosphate isomerase/epimerase [Lentisphaerota bacterium]MCP4100520.1 sugar phosphate isomerase/epimerase [Lentisphaerota bacterium]
MQRTCRELHRAQFMGVKDFTIHPPMVLDPEVTNDERCKLFCKFLNKLSKFIEENSIKINISLENVFDDEAMLKELGELLKIIKNAGCNNTALCLDTGHLNVIGQKPDMIIEGLPANSVSAVHLHDNYGITDNHNLPGDGNINWSGVFTALKSINFDNPLIFEVLSEKSKSIRTDIDNAWNSVKNAMQNPPGPSSKSIIKPNNSLTTYLDDLRVKYDYAELMFSKGKYEDAVKFTIKSLTQRDS